MTDRIIVYPAAIPQDTDILNTNRNMMIALGYLAQMVLGVNTIVDGLAVAPGAGLTVTIGQGSILSLQVIDILNYGTLPADAVDPLMKLGINPFGLTSFTCSAPTTSGDSINYLIEGTFQEVNNTPIVLPYYNAANPTQPYSGPNNTGADNNTLRQELVELQLKVGTPAPTGTQSTPSVDTGYIGLYVVTVAFGQVTITTGNIATYAGAPFLKTKMYALSWQGSAWADSGAANVMVATINPGPASLAALTGVTLKITMANSNTGATTLNINGLGAISVVTQAGAALGSGALVAGGIYQFVYNGTNFMYMA